MKILIGLSGGLDSTYAAHLLKEQGHEVVGASVLMHEYTDISAAESVAKEIGIPFVIIDYTDVFKEKVIARFISDYKRGRTPNPCVECNPNVKLGALCDYAVENGFDKVATGHYALTEFDGERYYVKADAESGKDQSYVLWKLSQKQLSLLYLPLKGMDKAEIRAKASSLGFKAAQSRDSQDICFIPDKDYIGYIKRETGLSFSEGDFLDIDGNVIGKHKGIINYTVGQRKGLGAFGKPMFVYSINGDNNTVTLVPSGSEFSGETVVSELNFMKLPPIDEGQIEAMCRIRYSAKPAPCKVTFKGGKAYVVFENDVRAVTPGQSAVFYEGNDVLFGGIIE